MADVLRLKILLEQLTGRSLSDDECVTYAAAAIETLIGMEGTPLDEARALVIRRMGVATPDGEVTGNGA